jgi:hypothetical protein
MPVLSRPLLLVGRGHDGSEKLQVVDDGAAFDHIRPGHAPLNIVMVFGAGKKVRLHESSMNECIRMRHWLGKHLA